MDQKKVIEKLLKIAVNQQKIIEKLAQAQSPAPMSMNTARPQTHTVNAIREALKLQNPQADASIARLEDHGNEMRVQFVQGGATQANYDAIMKVMNELTAKNVLAHSYKLVAS